MSKDIVEVNNTINQIDLVDIYRTVHLIAAKYTFFSSVHGVFTRIGYILGHKTSLNEFERIQVTQNMNNGI